MKDIEELINKTINEEPQENIRLPTNLRPTNYRLKLFPILDEFVPNNFTYTGEVKIRFECLTKTNKIVLNVEDLDIRQANVTVMASKIEPQHSAALVRDVRELSETLLVQNGTTNGTEMNNSTDGLLIGAEVMPLIIQEVYREEENFKLIIVMRNLLESGHNYTVRIKFAGNITNNLVGFYRTSYKDSSREKR